MWSSPPNRQSSAPQPSVHALKPLTKILSFGPSARKPLRVERWVPAPAWSTDVKSRGRGLWGPNGKNFFKKRTEGYGLGARPAGYFPEKTGPHPIFRP